MYEVCWDINLVVLCMRNIHGYVQVTPKQSTPSLTRKKSVSVRAVVNRNIDQISSPHEEKVISKRPRHKSNRMVERKSPSQSQLQKRPKVVSIPSPQRPQYIGLEPGSSHFLWTADLSTNGVSSPSSVSPGLWDLRPILFLRPLASPLGPIHSHARPISPLTPSRWPVRTLEFCSMTPLTRFQIRSR